MSSHLYIVNGRTGVRVIQQPVMHHYQQRNYYAPPPSQFLSQAEQVNIESIEGIQVVEEYVAEAGDPVVIEQAIFRGEVVQKGNKEKQVADENEAIIISEGYASEDGKLWKSLPKIMLTLFKIGQLSIQNINKVKAKFDSKLVNHKIMKINCENSDYYLAFREDVFNEWFLRLLWAKMMIDKRQVDQYGEWGSNISGKIFKKSQILGQWQPRIVKITRAGLISSKDESSSGSLQIKSTKQIWTRFQEIKGGYYIVVKLWYGIIKEQFAIPYRESLKWLYHFLTLLKIA